MIISIIVFVLVLSILVFVHELGHFMVAKWTGMRVDEFAIGFPPRIFGVKRGETTYAINALPLGGYVKIHGENGHEEDPDPRAFNNRPIWARVLVLVAGVTMNLLFAFVVLCVAYSVGFPSLSAKIDAIPGAVVEKSDVYVGGALAGSPADKAGIRAGDKILTITASGEAMDIPTVAKLQEVTESAKGGSEPVTIRTERNGAKVSRSVVLATDGPPLGVSVSEAKTVRTPFHRAPQAAVEAIGVIGGSTWEALVDFGRGLFRAELDENISGPVGIYKVTSAAADEGVASVIFIMIALSVNLALLNILPIPVLDGGKLVFQFIELLFRKRAVAMQVEGAITSLAFIMLVGLIAVITLRDLGLF